MLSYMIPPSDDAGKAGSSPQQAAHRQQPMVPMVHKARARQHPAEPPPPPPATNGHPNGSANGRTNGVEVPVNGQHHSAATTVVVNDGGSTTTTTTFSSTSSINGTVHTTKKIIKTHRDQPVLAPASYGGMSTESSASSLSTAASEQANTPTSSCGDKPKPKLLANGTKNPGLKRWVRCGKNRSGCSGCSGCSCSGCCTRQRAGYSRTGLPAGVVVGT